MLLRLDASKTVVCREGGSQVINRRSNKTSGGLANYEELFLQYISLQNSEKMFAIQTDPKCSPFAVFTLPQLLPLLKFDAAGVGRLLSSSSSSSPGWVTGCPAGFQTDTPPAGRWPDGPREGKVGDVIASQRVCEMCREGKWGLGRRRLFSLLPNNSLLSG